MHGIVSVLNDPQYSFVEGLWAELEEACGLQGIQKTPIPHFSWQVAEDYDFAALRPALQVIAETTQPFSVRSTGLGIFSGQNQVLYIPVVREAPLSQLHAQIWLALAGISLNPSPLYAPPIWMPHITLAHSDLDRERLDCALHLLAFRSFDWEIVVDNLTLVYQENDLPPPFYRRSMISPEFWQSLEDLVREKPLKIDRPKGSGHPRYPDMHYPLDYGFLEGTSAGDGDGIDVWVGSQADQKLQALLLTIDLNKNDAEIKLVIGCTPAEQQAILTFMNQSRMKAVLVHPGNLGLDLLHQRSSVRRFSDRKVDRQLLERLLEAAARAPSSHNQQPWRFVALETRPPRQRLASAMGAEFRKDLEADGFTPETVDFQVERSYQRIVEAPLAVLVCLDMSTVDSYPDASRQRAAFLMSVQSVAMAGENLLLAAHASGLGAVWMCAPLFAPHIVQNALVLPEGWQPQGLVLLGYPAKPPTPRERKPLADICLYLDE
jgi:coenzyme F420-0:L-glutamate ligase/coenzyme F420-1:gamma-L-glutamate ligase